MCFVIFNVIMESQATGGEMVQKGAQTSLPPSRSGYNSSVIHVAGAVVFLALCQDC